MIIEIDGASHASSGAREYDNIRYIYFKELGYTTLRFLNEEVKSETERVLRKVKSYLVLTNK